jgi:hypothetical protein
MDLRVGYRLKDGRADDSFMKTIKQESGKSQLNAFNKPIYFSNMKEIRTTQFTSAEKRVPTRGSTEMTRYNVLIPLNLGAAGFTPYCFRQGADCLYLMAWQVHHVTPIYST